MDLPFEIHKYIWKNVRQLIYKDRHKRLISELKRFVEDQRHNKYYISKRDPDNQSMFMYLNFTLNEIMDNAIGTKWGSHQGYTLYIWTPYFDKYSRYIEPIRKPTLKLIIMNFLWDINCFYWSIYHYLVGSIFVEVPERYGYYLDQYSYY